ncbi:glycosyltransferase family 9 protein [Uliginosibacterium sp. H1]|uniref:glycosyltransferase family 9 protein n=1 Tax=Uliginosibacterium sp. H1 TaxID=3114757 RepID=UPI002E186909|nr:tetratricopeptide repeat protein [Uliginosibacterium sp. H1]
MPRSIPDTLAAAIAADEAGHLDEAVALYAEVLAADPGCVDALLNLGALAFRVGQFAEAANFQREALALRPDFQPARINLARTLARLGEVDEADVLYRQLQASAAATTDLQSEHIQLLYGDGRLAAARELADAACELLPREAECWLLAGNVRLYQRDRAGAERCYRQALACHDNSRGRANLALALLAQDRFGEAWPLYEARYAADLQAHDKVAFAVDGDPPPWPQWQGESLAGKRILVMGEQGMGDQIHFARFLPQLAALGASVELVCAAPLLPLLTATPGVAAVHARPPANAAFDCWTPLLSLPWRLGQEDGRAWPGAPYLQAPADRQADWRKQFAQWAGTSGLPRVGIAWAGSPGNAIDRMRSLPLDAVLDLAERLRGRVMLLSLQKGAGELADIDRQCAAGIVPLADLIHDFGDTAAIVAELDCVIMVDTALAHVAGALGKPGFVLLSPGADWRWGTEGDTAAALYPSLRPLWRDPVAGWKPALERVEQALGSH